MAKSGTVSMKLCTTIRRALRTNAPFPAVVSSLHSRQLTFKLSFAQVLGTAGVTQPPDMTAADLVTKIGLLKLISSELTGLTDNLIALADGMHIQPNLHIPGEATITPLPQLCRYLTHSSRFDTRWGPIWINTFRISCRLQQSLRGSFQTSHSWTIPLHKVEHRR
jgi:hypothetical protein